MWKLAGARSDGAAACTVIWARPSRQIRVRIWSHEGRVRKSTIVKVLASAASVGRRRRLLRDLRDHLSCVDVVAARRAAHAGAICFTNDRTF